MCTCANPLRWPYFHRKLQRPQKCASIFHGSTPKAGCRRPYESLILHASQNAVRQAIVCELDGRTSSAEKCVQIFLGSIPKAGCRRRRIRALHFVEFAVKSVTELHLPLETTESRTKTTHCQLFTQNGDLLATARHVRRR